MSTTTCDTPDGLAAPDSRTGRTRPGLVLALLFLATFTLGYSEELVVGVLDLIAADLRVPIPAAGGLVTAYAIGLAIGGPVLDRFRGGAPPGTRTPNPLVKDRMDITGARWGLHGAEAVLKLRAVRANGDFPDYWAFHLAQERQRVHQTRYANGVIPQAA